MSKVPEDILELSREIAEEDGQREEVLSAGGEWGYDDDEGGMLCANCGSPDVSIYWEPETYCSTECLDEHERKGCPQESGEGFREKPTHSDADPSGVEKRCKCVWEDGKAHLQPWRCPVHDDT